VLFKKKQQHTTLKKTEIFGIEFPGIFALEKGYDVFCEKFERLNSRSAFIEIGPVTPEIQNINHLKGIFRHTVYGQFPSKGVKQAINNLSKAKSERLIAANISYSIDHFAVEDISSDITTCFTYLYDFVDFFIIDTFRASYTSGNALQDVDILSEVIEEILQIRRYYETNKPIVLRVDSNICEESLNEILDYVRMSGIDGVALRCNAYEPSFVKHVIDITKGRLPLLVSGGIDTTQKAKELLDLGVSIIQLKDIHFDEISSSIYD